MTASVDAGVGSATTGASGFSSATTCSAATFASAAGPWICAGAPAGPTINCAEGVAPSAVNDSARAQMAAEKKFFNDALSMAHTTGGTSTAYTLTTDSGLGSLAHLDKQVRTFVPNVTSGASPTLKVDGLGPKPINGPELLSKVRNLLGE